MARSERRHDSVGSPVPIELTHRLVQRLPDARVETIANSYTFVPEDQPQRLAELIAQFARTGAAAS